jgi:MFS family permease
MTVAPPGPTDATAPEVPVLRLPVVRRFIAAFGISAVGSAMVAVAVAFVAYKASRSVVLTVIVVGANAAPALVLSPLVARLATRRDPRTVEIAGQLAKMLLSLALAVIAAAGDLSYPVLLVTNALNGMLSALIAPAWPRITRMVAPEGRLAEVTSAFSAAGSMAAIGGALAGGIVVTTVGATWVFVFNAVTYLPVIAVVRALKGPAPAGGAASRAIRRGIELVRREEQLRRAFLLAAVLNFAAWPLLSVLPAVAQDIDARAHVLGLLVAAFYAGAAAVSWVVGRLRRRLPYGRILFLGFVLAGLLLVGNAVLTGWRSPGYDAVTVAVVTLVPIGLAVALNSSLLQALVQLSTPDGDQAPVLVVYATVTTIVTPIGGLLIGALADTTSMWVALAVCGVGILVLAVALRSRFTVFDQFGELDTPVRAHHHALHLAHLFGWDVARGATPH